MASESSSQQTLRKAIEAIKDSTSVGMAKVNSEYKEIKVSILKATNHVDVLPKEKHVRAILGALSGSRPRADVSYCIHTLTKRLAKTHSWVVALKTLIIIHRALREVDHSFCEELLYHNHRRGHVSNLSHFSDDSSHSAWDYSTWIRTYALYIEECLECFRVLKYDFYRDHTRTKKFDAPALLEQLPALQELLFRLLSCQPIGAARYNFMVQYALSIVAAESVRLYVAITDGVLILVDKFFEMQRRDAVKALEIYRRAVEQAQRLSDFFEMCRSLDFGKRQKYVKIEQPPASFLIAMEQYVKDAPQTLMLPWTGNTDECVTPKLVAVPEAKFENDTQATSEEGSHSSDDSHKNDTDVPPLIPDLLSWDEPGQETTELGERNSLPLVTATPEDLSNNNMMDSEVSSQPASWELALVTTTSSDAPSVALCKGGVLDRSLLDSLYDAALTKTNTNVAHQPAKASFNPFETDDYAYNQNMFYTGYNYNQNMFYDPSLVGHQILMQQQAAFMQHHDHQERSMVVYDSMQISGVPQQQPASTEQYYQQTYLQIAGIAQQPPASTGQQHHHKQESSFVSDDFEQMNEMPQLEASVQQQREQEKPVFGHDSTHKFGNPFVEQSSSQVEPQSQCSNFSLL